MGPARNPWHEHRERLRLGQTYLSCQEVHRVLNDLKTQWSGESYSYLRRNCQTFAVALCENLGLGACIPQEYCRCADIAESMVSTLPISSVNMVKYMSHRLAPVGDTLTGSADRKSPGSPSRSEQDADEIAGDL